MKIRSIDKSTSQDILFQIKSLIMDNWGDEYNNTGELERELLLAQNTLKLPNVYFLVDKKEVIATISLLKQDLEGCSEYSPWLANLFVKQSHRLKGIASTLCAKIIEDAKEFGYKEVYLYTHDATDFYTKKNWIIIKKLLYKNINHKLLKISV